MKFGTRFHAPSLDQLQLLWRYISFSSNATTMYFLFSADLKMLVIVSMLPCYRWYLAQRITSPKYSLTELLEWLYTLKSCYNSYAD